MLGLAVTASLVVASCGASDTSPEANPQDASEPTVSAVASEVDETQGDTPASEPEDAVDQVPVPGPEPEPEPELAVATEPYTIELDDGVSVVVPAGERTDVTAEMTDVSHDGFVVDLQPDGATFATPVQLLVPFEDAADDEVAIELLTATLTSKDGSSELLPVTATDEGVAFEIVHFSSADVERVTDAFRTALLFVESGLFVLVDPEGDLEASRALDPMAIPVGTSTLIDVAGIHQKFPDLDERAQNRGMTNVAFAAEFFKLSVFPGGPLEVANERDERAGIVTCVKEGTGIYRVTEVDEGAATSASITGTITCVPPALKSDGVVMTQIHLQSDLPPEVVSIGVPSAVKAAMAVAAEADRWTQMFLIRDVNMSGAIDAGDMIPFAPVDSASEVWLPIDQGGSYFFGLVRTGDQFTAEVGAAFGDVVVNGDGTISVAGFDRPLVVTLTPDCKGVAYWNVDFGEPLMAPLP